MKRALAERAKGDNLAPDLPISDSSRLPKTPRLTQSTSDAITPSTTAGAVTGPTSGTGASVALASLTSPSPLQSMLPTFISSTTLPTGTSGISGNDDDTQDRAYYLQYQNRALVGELHRLKHVVQTLEQERLARRTQCDLARQCVDTIHGMWHTLENSLASTIAKTSSRSADHLDQHQEKSVTAELIPFSSSGEGTNVETVSGLLRALYYLASQLPLGFAVESTADASFKNETTTSSMTSSSFNLQTTLTGIQTRVSNLQSMILSLLDAVFSDQNKDFAESARIPLSNNLTEYSQYATKVSTLQGQLDAFHVLLEEISTSRDDALLREKRIRRYLLRIMAGQAKEDVLRDVELEADDVMMDESIMDNNDDTDISALMSTVTPGKRVGKGTRHSAEASASSEQVEKFQDHISDLEAKLSTRQEQIEELIKERFQLQSTINSHLFKKENSTHLNDEGRTETKGQHEALEREVVLLRLREQNLLSEVDQWKKQLARSKGELDAINKGMDDQYLNFIRRWKEITGEGEDGEDNVPKDGKLRADLNGNEGVDSEKAVIATLEHKLQQALEGARRGEVFRQNISELNILIESLQKQNEEWKEKYQSMQVQHSQVATSVAVNRGATKSEGGDKKPPEVGSSPSAQGSKDSSNGSLLERLQKDNRKMRKEIATQQANRDAQKSKVEHLRNERDALTKSNQRLIQQSVEKEEINAEALSTILQLRQRLELHAQEKEEWEKKFKASQQLALAARLAATAKERVDDELKKEKEDLEKMLQESKAENVLLMEKHRILEFEFAARNVEITSVKEELDVAQSRCDDLLSESNVILKAKASALEELHVTRKKYFEAKKSVAKGAESADDQAGEVQFTAKQLSTQLDVYKSRLACPVCNSRDKGCILLRCRHMFCRQCVDTSIKVSS